MFEPYQKVVFKPKISKNHRVQSLSKNKIKWIRSLRMKKHRDQEGCFVLEGEKMVQEAIHERPEDILCLCTTDAEMIFSGECYLVSEAEMKAISGLSTPASLLAVIRMPVFPETKANFILAIDGVQDPGNMGTIIRTADWFGVDRIVCSKETVDVFNSKVIQSTMGSIFRVPVSYTDLSNFISESELPVYGALLEGKSMRNITFEPQGILLVGNEGKGISQSLLPWIDHPVLIPGKGGAESLNVAVATGILLAAFTR